MGWTLDVISRESFHHSINTIETTVPDNGGGAESPYFEIIGKGKILVIIYAFNFMKLNHDSPY